MRINSISTYNSGDLNFKPKSPQNQNVSFGNIVGSADDMIKALNSLPDWKKGLRITVEEAVQALEDCKSISALFDAITKRLTVEVLINNEYGPRAFLIARLGLKGPDTFILTEPKQMDRFVMSVRKPSVSESASSSITELPEALGPVERALSYITGV